MLKYHYYCVKAPLHEIMSPLVELARMLQCTDLVYELALSSYVQAAGGCKEVIQSHLGHTALYVTLRSFIITGPFDSAARNKLVSYLMTIVNCCHDLKPVGVLVEAIHIAPELLFTLKQVINGGS